ncbi:recombinase family protein [Kineosporia babensis]|uniref:Recombinase family protein n=1 Tax=Kineosporia babensis TaxID=499548 RepID=A0A9X1SV36_9ACTN|nr:recombinase family protein [Kineosporia babensis]MCD5313572.1 recombinase family protein [Kineosporia babensis]
MVRAPRKALIYVRQSTYKEESISPEVQIEQCLSHCRREGYEVIGEPVMDLDLSGRTFTKRKIQPLIDRVRDGEANTVVVWRWSRWGRNLVESLRCIAELKQVGGRLESATEPIDASTPAGRFSVTQMLAIAEFQSDQIGESWRDARRAMIAKGLPSHGGPRLGYVYDKPAKRYTIDPVTGPIFRECYEMYRDGKSMHALVLHLRDRDVRSLLGNPMSESALRGYLDSGFAAGLIVLNKPETFFSEDRMEELGIGTTERPVFLPGSWDPIISEDLWLSYRERRRVQALKPKRSRNPRQHLSGHLRCAGCGKRMLYRPERSRWVCCSQLTKDGAPCPVHVSVSNSEATEFTKDWLRSLAGEYGESFDSLVAEQMKRQDANTDRDAVQSQLLTEERRRENLVRAVSTGAFEAADVADEMRLIKKEIERLKIVLASLKRQGDRIQTPSDGFLQLLQNWEAADASTASVLLEQVLEGIYVYPFRTRPRMSARAVWESEKKIPRAEPPDLDFSQGRTCTKCQEWKPRSEFTIYGPARKMKPRCKLCTAAYTREWQRSRRA